MQYGAADSAVLIVMIDFDSAMVAVVDQNRTFLSNVCFMGIITVAKRKRAVRGGRSTVSGQDALSRA